MGDVVDVQLQVAGDDDQLADLHDWLRQEPELRGRVEAVPGTPNPGELGTGTDLLTVAAGSGGALAVLAASLKTYFAQPRRSDVKITIRAADGRTVEIDAQRVKDVDALVAGILDQTR